MTSCFLVSYNVRCEWSIERACPLKNKTAFAAKMWRYLSPSYINPLKSKEPYGYLLVVLFVPHVTSSI